MLFQYRTDLNNLLQNPGATNALYPTASLDRFINIARGQIAGESEGIRIFGSLTTSPGTSFYTFNALVASLGPPNVTGVKGIIHVRSLAVVVGEGEQWLNPHAWEWFNFYYLNTVTPATGRPVHWAQYGQGTSDPVFQYGSFFVYPVPDAAYTLFADCVCYPIALTNDTDPEALPYMWQDAVPFFAAYYAFLASQTSARQADAERMYKHFETFMERARKQANPAVLRNIYEQAGDPTQANKLGVRLGGAGG